MLFPLLFYYILHILRIIKDKLANLQSKGARLVAIFALKVGDKELEHAVLRAPQIPLFCDGLEQAATTLFFLNQSICSFSFNCLSRHRTCEWATDLHGFKYNSQ